MVGASTLTAHSTRYAPNEDLHPRPNRVQVMLARLLSLEQLALDCLKDIVPDVGAIMKNLDTNRSRFWH